jgi:hypothetical protein
VDLLYLHGFTFPEPHGLTFLLKSAGEKDVKGRITAYRPCLDFDISFTLLSFCFHFHGVFNLY